ncbi:MAG: trypsin-like peptidase domain-containing protein [Prolixibacteraceae bacterium]|nr:trypsin-like peptidase domain-containing protein [Prolixibacteraceae bacterium]
MARLIITVLILLMQLVASSQVRQGWRCIYDKEGRLSQMLYYDRGIQINDSSHYFQYYTDNIVKGIINGEISLGTRSQNGQRFLFDETGNLSSFSIERGGQTIFYVSCDYNGNCTSTWIDKFDSPSDCWLCDSFTVSGSDLILHNNQSMQVALYNPPVGIDINNQFVLYARIPVGGNNVKQGVVFGWENDQNYYLLEITHGEYYSILCYENGNLKQITGARETIEKKGEEYNDIRISSNGKNLLFEINNVIENVIAFPNFKGNHIGLTTRSRGNARFSDFGFKYPLPFTDQFYSDKWVGKSTGFFISPSGKILTTYDALSDSKRIRVKGKINGKTFQLPVKIISVEEDMNLAVLQISDKDFKPFEKIPFGYTNKKPLTDATVYSLGYPNAISGKIMPPEVFYGKVLPSSGAYSNYRQLEMPFRFGMIGSPVFDNDANLIGIVAYKGLELEYTEAIDFYENARLFQAYMGRFEREIDSPIKNASPQEMINALSEIVVIIESSIFDLESSW